jgi:hypothetical protein
MPIAAIRHVLVVSFSVSAGFMCRAEEPFVLDEPATDSRVKLIATEVHTSGKVYTAIGGGKTAEHALDAVAAFRYRERRLPPGGRDARALRALREMELASLVTRVADHETRVELPSNLQLIVVRGEREGCQSFCPESPMTRESVDLLELPGDPLALTALLPRTTVDAGAEWKPPEWAPQMLATIEAVDKLEMTCRLASADAAAARVEFTGRVTGQRQGANTEVDITGHLVFDRLQRLIVSATAKYVIKTSIGATTPGIDATVDVTVDRSLSPSPGRLKDTLAESIPLEPPPQLQDLVFNAEPWGVRLAHDRNWHLFQSLLEGTLRVVILRLMDRGNLICQCNISPVASVSPGQATPPEQFEADVRQALGKRLLQVESREQIPAGDGGTILRVLTSGEIELAGENGTVKLPMNWIYYLCTDTSGKQVSFVFSVEPAYLEALAGRDLAMVKSLRFVKR